MRFSVPSAPLRSAARLRATASEDRSARNLRNRSAWLPPHRFVDLQSLEWLFFAGKFIHADNDFFLAVHRHLVAIRRIGDFPLRVAAFDGRNHPAHLVDFPDVLPGRPLRLRWSSVSRKYDPPSGSADVRDAAFVRQDLLRAQRERRRKFGGQRPGLVQRIGVQGLRPAHHRGQRLQRRAHHVVVGLLRGERASRRLRVKSQRPRARQFRAKPLGHHPVPDAPRGAVLGDLLEEIVVRVEEKRKPRRELVDGQARARRPTRRIRFRRAA